MKLSQKIGLSFVAVIVMFGAVSGFASSRLLDARMRHEVATAEVMFARSLATRIFKFVRERDAIQVTDVLFDEQQLRAEKIEYLLVTDKDDKVLAHTFLAPVPEVAKSLTGHPLAGIVKSDTNSQGQVRIIDTPTLFVFDVAVPVFEGIVPIGMIHVGLKGEYLQALKVDVERLTLLAIIGVGLLAFVLSAYLTRVIVSPLRKLTLVANELSNANLDVVVPEINTRDEISDLANAMTGVMAALVTLMNEVEPQAPPSTTECSGSSEPASEAM